MRITDDKEKYGNIAEKKVYGRPTRRENIRDFWDGEENIEVEVRPVERK